MTKLVLAALWFFTVQVFGQVDVHFPEGSVHGFLLLRAEDGSQIAEGNLDQVSRGGRLTNHLQFRFKDGSTHDETAVYTQRKLFRLQNYHLLQKGPSFKEPEELTIDVPKGLVTVRYEHDGKPEVKDEHMKLPPDLANGMMSILTKNFGKDAGEVKLSMVVATPKPRLVKLAITSAGEEAFRVGDREHKSVDYRVKIELGGLAGVVAPIVGKEPPDIHVWISKGEVPAFLKSTGPLFVDGPIWTIELASPQWKPE